jgi:hypothetical protein
MLAGASDEAEAFADALRNIGFNVATLPGQALADLPWPAPASTLAFDVSTLRMTIGNQTVALPYDTDLVGVYCRPPADRFLKPTVNLGRAVASGHGPTISEAIQRTSILDLYFLEGGALQRVTVLPGVLDLDGDRVLKELGKRAKALRLDTRLAGVRPRAPFLSHGSFDGSERRRYSFGTLLLRDVLESIAFELRSVPQYEFGSRLSYALRPLAAPGG